MVLNFFDSWSLFAIVTEDFKNKVFEVIRQVLTSNLFPIMLKLSLENQVIEILILLGFLEWEDSLDDDEKDDTT